MHRLIHLATAWLLTLPLAAIAQSSAPATKPPIRISIGEIKVQAVVVELDRANRMATLRTAKGHYVTVSVPVEIHNFDQVHVGDELVVQYGSAIAAQIEPASKSGIRELIEPADNNHAQAAESTGIAAARKVTIIAIIRAIDRKAGTATIQGATRTVTIAIPASVDVAKLKVGDEVHATFTDAVVVSLERAASSTAKK